MLFSPPGLRLRDAELVISIFNSQSQVLNSNEMSNVLLFSPGRILYLLFYQEPQEPNSILKRDDQQIVNMKVIFLPF